MTPDVANQSPGNQPQSSSSLVGEYTYQVYKVDYHGNSNVSHSFTIIYLHVPFFSANELGKMAPLGMSYYDSLYLQQQQQQQQYRAFYPCQYQKSDRGFPPKYGESGMTTMQNPLTRSIEQDQKVGFNTIRNSK